MFKTTIKLVTILAGVLLLSALLAPVLYEHLPIQFKFERIFNRLVMIFTVAAAIFFVRFKRPSLASYGILWNDRSLRDFSRGAMISLGVLGIAVLFKIGIGITAFEPRDLSAGVWVSRVIKIILSAFLIGIVEEFFFRGYILNQLRNQWNAGLPAALFLTNIFYSLIHFVGDNPPLIGPDPTFFDSLRLVVAPFKAFAAFDQIWSSALGLFLFGLILTRIAIKTQSLYGAIGVHAGCVFFLKLDGSFFVSKPVSVLLWGSDNVYDGLLGWGFLGLIAVLVEIFFPSSKPNLETNNG